MNFKINPQITRSFPEYNLGVILIKGIDNEKILSATHQLLTGVIAEKKAILNKTGIESSPRIGVWRTYLEKFGVNIEKHPPLLERIFKSFSKSEIIFFSALEDLLNYASIKYELPVWGIDIDELCGDLELIFSIGRDPFILRGSAKLFYTDSGEVVFKDRAGVVSKIWNTYESERTALMPFTKNACVFVENASAYDLEKLKSIAKEISSFIMKYCKGSAEVHILGDTVFEIDLGVSGKTGITDSQFMPDPKRIMLQQKFLKGPVKPPARFWVIKQGAKKEKKPKPEKTEKSAETEKPLKTGLPSEALTKEGKSPRKEIPAKRNKNAGEKETKLIKEKLREILKVSARKTFASLESIPEFLVEFPKESYFGDYSSNIALVLTKLVGRSPREVFDELMIHLEKPQYISEITFAEPGFINFSLNKIWAQNELENIISEKIPYAGMNIGNSENIVVDFSSPNIAKPLGVHHLLSTTIGQAIINIYKFIGYNPIGINYIGDWGTQFGKLITAYKLWGDKKIIEKNPTDEMLKLYVKFHDEAEADKSLEDKAREEFKKLEDKDEENLKLWEWFKELSLKDIQKTYDALGNVYFDYFIGESFYNNKMEDVLKEGKEKGIFVVGEEGALIVKYENDELPPYLVQKSDGATLYSTRDIASIKHRISEWHPAKLIYVVDKSQSLHFKQLFKTIELLKWEKPECIHVDFGRMDFKDEKMSTRKGNIILLDEVLKEAVEKAKAIIEQKNPKLKEKEKDEIAQIVGIGAVKYSILSQNRATDITFDWDKMLSLESNSSCYLQYTYIRAISILNKYKEEFGPKKKKTKGKKEEPAGQTSLFDMIDQGKGKNAAAPTELTDEKELLTSKLLVKFPEYIIESAEEYRPNILSNYLYELAQNFNAFYHTTPVLQSEKENLRELRLKLTTAVAKIISTGLKLLGIECPEKM